MRPIHDAGNAPLARQGTDILDGKNLARHESHLRHMDDACPRRDSLFEQLHQISRFFYRYGEVQLFEHNLFPALALLPGSDHPWIVLAGRQDLVTRCKIKPKLRDLQRFARIPRDRNTLRIGIPQARKSSPYVLDLGFQVAPHTIARSLIAIAYRFDLSFQHRRRRWRNSAIVEVKNLWIVPVRVADALPVVLVTG